MRDPTGLRQPGFLEIDLDAETVNVTHHAWSGMQWNAVPLLVRISLADPPVSVGSI
jgi:hypothetical protein